MQRVVTIIALVFAFASLAGATMAHAHRYQSLAVESLVVLNHVNEQNVSIPVYVTVQRGEIDLGSGIVMPCGPHHAISPTVPGLLPSADCDKPIAATTSAEPLWPMALLLRPPIAA